MHTEEVSDHFPEYKDVCQYWKNLAEGLTKSIGDTMAVMLQSNNELNELTTVSLAGLQKCIAKFDKVFIYLIIVNIKMKRRKFPRKLL